MNGYENEQEINLNNLLVRESEQVEWKENVADCDDVVSTLSAFANDCSNLGGGYVVCGAAETKDEHGFPKVEVVGLTAARIKEIEGRVIAGCRDRVSPSILPLIREIATIDPARRVLVFIIAATPHAHTFRRGSDGAKHMVRISRQTCEARNGILRELLVRKNAVEPWDRRICATATTNDLDLVALRDALQRMNAFDPRRGIDDYLSDTQTLSSFVPPLCGRDPLSGVLRPRNFAMLLFGRQVQKHVSGAYSLVSIYPGKDRSEPHAERHELDGSIIEQARQAIDILGVQSYIAFDKTDERVPNAVKYPRKALTEGLVNSLAHRDYEMPDPCKTTVFADRVEILSPGSLPVGVQLEQFREGRASPKWRNQALAWFLSRLQFAQAEGQGIPTIIRSMREEGCPDPVFEANDARVICTLPAHPRHALAREYREIEEAISLGEFDRAAARAQALLAEDALNSRAVQLMAEVCTAQRNPEPARAYVSQHRRGLPSLPPRTLVQLAEAFEAGDGGRAVHEEAKNLYILASRGLMDEREARRVAYGLSKAGDDHRAVEFLEQQFKKHPDWLDSPYLLQARGNSYVGMAKQCSKTMGKDGVSPETRRRAQQDCFRFLESAKADLNRAAQSTDPFLRETVEGNLAFAERVRWMASRQRWTHKGGQRSPGGRRSG